MEVTDHEIYYFCWTGEILEILLSCQIKLWNLARFFTIEIFDGFLNFLALIHWVLRIFGISRLEVNLGKRLKSREANIPVQFGLFKFKTYGT